MKILRKITGIGASLMLCLTPFSALATEEPIPESPIILSNPGDNSVSEEGLRVYNTPEYRALLDEKVAEQTQAIQPLSLNGDVILPTSQYIQETDYYCMPASAQILIEYVTGVYYTQDYLASLMGTTSAYGTYVDAAAPVINNLTGAGYAYANTNDYYFWDNMVSNVSRGYPVIYSVDPYYFYVGYGHCGHAVLGNGYGDNQKVWYWDVYGPYANLYYLSASDLNIALNANGGFYIW